jgi:hypothetical protein
VVANLLLCSGRVPDHSSYLRFAAEMLNECWQSDFTHYRLTRLGGDAEILA